MDAIYTERNGITIIFLYFEFSIKDQCEMGSIEYIERVVVTKFILKFIFVSFIKLFNKKNASVEQKHLQDERGLRSWRRARPADCTARRGRQLLRELQTAKQPSVENTDRMRFLVGANVAITQGIATLGQAWANVSKQYWANMRLPGMVFDGSHDSGWYNCG